MHVRPPATVISFLVPFARTIVVWLLVASLAAAASGPSPKSLAKQAEKAERKGDVVRAYLLYAQAAAQAPDKPEYWARSQALRTKAALKARPLPKIETGAERPSFDAPEPPAEGFSNEITDHDLAEIRRMLPPPELKPNPERRNVDIRGDAKSLYERVAKAWGLEAVFDGDYQTGSEIRLRLEDTDFDGAIRALDAASSSFTVALGEKLMFVAKDTPQKRRDMEPTIAVTIPILDTVTPQEAQELGRAVQQSFDIAKLSIDSAKRLVLIRDRVSRVRPAQLIFEQLAAAHPQVAIEVEFLEVDRSALVSYGLMLPTEFPIFWLGNQPKLGTLQNLATFLFGHTVLGIGIGNAQLFANMSSSYSKTLLHSILRGSDGQPLTFHAGDKYPIATGGLLGGAALGIPPSFTFEDLGLVLKITPKVHGAEEVTLDVEAEFKVLSGKALNGIPIIANRQFQSTVRLKHGEWGILAGLMNTSEARSVSGLPGVISAPIVKDLFAKNDRERSSTEVVLLLKPQLLSIPPSALLTRGLWVGSEARAKIPI